MVDRKAAAGLSRLEQVLTAQQSLAAVTKWPLKNEMRCPMPARMIIAMLLALLISIPAIAQDINSQLVEAAKNGDTVSIKALLDAGADVDAKDVNDRTALIWAAQKGHTETAQALLEAGAT